MKEGGSRSEVQRWKTGRGGPGLRGPGEETLWGGEEGKEKGASPLCRWEIRPEMPAAAATVEKRSTRSVVSFFSSARIIPLNGSVLLSLSLSFALVIIIILLHCVAIKPAAKWCFYDCLSLPLAWNEDASSSFCSSVPATRYTHPPHCQPLGGLQVWRATIRVRISASLHPWRRKDSLSSSLSFNSCLTRQKERKRKEGRNNRTHEFVFHEFPGMERGERDRFYRIYVIVHFCWATSSLFHRCREKEREREGETEAVIGIFFSPTQAPFTGSWLSCLPRRIRSQTGA